MSDWYTTSKPELSQGDIYVDVPTLYIREPVLTAATVTCTGHAQHLVPTQAEPELFGTQDRIMIGHGSLAHAVVLTHDCEIDKDKKYRMLALVRPLAGLPNEAIEEIKAHRRRRFFHLPAETELYPLEESYVDFRRITAVTDPVIPISKRVLSMQDHLRDSMREAFILYVTRAVA